MEYAFEEGVIRLNQRDLDKWKRAFSNLNLEAELIALAGWAATQENWYFAVAGALAKKNREMEAAFKQRAQQRGGVGGIY